jgi:hypothetical protein
MRRRTACFLLIVLLFVCVASAHTVSQRDASLVQSNHGTAVAGFFDSAKMYVDGKPEDVPVDDAK